MNEYLQSDRRFFAVYPDLPELVRRISREEAVRFHLPTACMVRVRFLKNGSRQRVFFFHDRPIFALCDLPELPQDS